MKQQKLVTSILAILLIIGLQAQAQDQVFTKEFQENVEARVEQNIITGIVVGVVTAEGTSFYSHGVKSLKTNEPVDEHTVFEIGSNTKTFTGLLLADEVVKGNLSLNTPLQELLPEGIHSPKRNGKEIQLVNLANHTSALPRLPDNFERTNRLNPYASLSFDQVYDFINNYELPYDIGTKWLYSNLATGVLGNVLADKNNTNYEDLVWKRISKPLGMGDTRITLSSNMQKRLAKGHSMGEEVENWDLPAIAGCGALLSTAEDMIKYLKANMGMLKSDLYPAMQLAHKSTGSGNGTVTTGLGWLRINIEGEEIIWHDGGTGGYMSFMGFTEDGTKGVVVLTNSTGFPDDIGFHLLNPESPLANPKPSLATKLNLAIKNEGLHAAEKTYELTMKENLDEYDTSNHGMLRLGYRFLYGKQLKEALFVLKANAEINSDDWNANDSYAEALLKNNEKELAIKYYKKSIELNSDNTGAIEKLKELGVKD